MAFSALQRERQMRRDRAAKPARGNPWSWRGCYWDHQPQTEVELLKRGFHIAYLSADATLKPDKTWEAWYAFLTGKHGLSDKPVFIGMSRGGEYSYTWATAHPDKVACIYADNPGANGEVYRKLGDLAAADVPLLHVCGSIDPLLDGVSNKIETIYREHGGRISVMIKEGAGHHPHSLRDPRPIADFIEKSVGEIAAERPAFVGDRVSRAAFFGTKSAYEFIPAEGCYITRRGPGFFPCYNRWSFALEGVEGSIRVIAPSASAEGRPWVFRADAVGRNSAVDLALLAKGFHIVTGPVPYNADGPSLAAWNRVYDHLTVRIRQEAGACGGRRRRGRGLCVGDRESGQGFVHLCRESDPAKRDDEACADRQPCSIGQGGRAGDACLRVARSCARRSNAGSRAALSRFGRFDDGHRAGRFGS